MPKNKKNFYNLTKPLNSIKKISNLKTQGDVENLWINYKYGKKYLVEN